MANSEGNIRLETLVGPGISVSEGDLGKYISANLVRVDGHVGRERGIIPMPTKQLGLKPEKLGEKGKDFYSGHMEAGRLCLIPKDYENRLEAIEARLRNAIRKLEVCDGFIPLAAYASLKNRYEEIKEEYFSVQEEVLASWDSIIQDFHQGAREMLKSIKMQERIRQSLYQQMVSSLPTKKRYQTSFYMTLTVTAFPAVAVPEGLNETIAADLDESWQNSVVSTAIRAIEVSCGKALSLLGQAAISYQERARVSGKTIDAMAHLASDLHWKNVFRNPTLSNVSNQLSLAVHAQSNDEREEIVEDAIVDLWAYAKDTGISLDLSLTPFDEATLTTLFHARELANRNQIAI